MNTTFMKTRPLKRSSIEGMALTFAKEPPSKPQNYKWSLKGHKANC